MKTYQIKCFKKTYQVRLEKKSYYNNKRLAVQMYTVPDGEPFARLTVNIDYPLSGDKETHAFIDTNNLGFMDIEKFLIQNQIAKPTGTYGESGYCTYPEYQFDLSKL